MLDDLRADCANCFALCCVAPAFAASADFAIDKPAGKPCPNLAGDFRCGIHSELRQRGFTGCTVFDCFGAGQKVSQVTFGGRDWREAPETAGQMFDVFAVMRSLHELLRYLTEARTFKTSVRAQLTEVLRDIQQLTRGTPEELLEIDVPALRNHVNSLLLKASEQARAGARRKPIDHRGADLIGAKLRNADLVGASLRGALLLGADLRNADLRRADVIGADLRGADLSGANLSGALFLVQQQLDAAKGDARTVLPPELRRPAHWLA